MTNVWEGLRNGAALWYQKLITEGYVTVIVKIIKVALIYVIARILIKLGSALIKGFYSKRRKSRFSMDDRKAMTLKALSQSVLKYAVYFIAVMSILPEFGIRVESIIATAGIGGLAIGFGAQSLVKDVISGFFILFEDQYAVGDYITVGEVTGTVEEIGLRITKIRGFKGELNIVPNGNILQVTNYTRGNALAIVDINIPYESDIDSVIGLLQKAAENYADHNDDIVEKPQVLGIMDLQQPGVSVRLIAKTKPMKHWGVERDLRKSIKNELDQKNIKVAYPHMVIVQSREKSEGREV